ncbi:PRTRC system protein E, partial [Burkholderia cepacia]
DQLRINVTPQQAKDAARKLWPLSIAGTPTELDEQFADSVAVYEPGALSVLDQARACAAANQSHSAPALPSPSASEAAGTPSKRGRGRPPKAAKADDANNPPATDGANAGTT